MSKKINVAVVGLSFGLEFVPIYLDHPDVESVVICDTNEKLLDVAKQRYNFTDEQCYTNIDDILENDKIDTVNIFTPPATHAPLSIKVLESGKNCGCTIPMGMSIDELKGVIAAKKKSGKKYMFLETSVFSREYFYVKELIDRGDFGRIQYMSCAHYQDMEGWPEYWEGFPPLMHPTHAIAPCIMLTGKLPSKVYAKGSGRIRSNLAKKYNSPFSFETALVSLEDSDISIELERFLYGVARSYDECFRVYGEKRSFEWQQLRDENPVLYTKTGKLKASQTYDFGDKSNKKKRNSEIIEKRIEIPDYADRLPKSIEKYTQKTVYNNKNTHLSFTQGGGHGGSHPHMIHEFVRSIIEDREPIINDVKGAYLTGVGICGHKSAMEGGREIALPDFRDYAKNC
ncbi:Gfo/Idh/MocA family oxidoreductase [Lactobacillus sp. ESL0791]|uniref:Gfo/Idh/MocA family protein n=1 Tax=Lactobacillus sp. ESL0791 TaxID=2983234 RepID=UPI0023F82028|nr:Gfo/Idh/MocA family oxidoreductase [Lactobacillus sp. ESL0791]MDF7637849.1 Gfo/Idh/MocA family oxidoreductase [Lactobacillus sp. ESL0791]